jgi:hypothetical protein
VSRDIYQAIMIAAACGKGLRITPEEAHELAMDDAIATAACNILSLEDYAVVENMNHWEFWRGYAKRGSK